MNVKPFLQGEEEVGSSSLSTIVALVQAHLAARL